jgi:hypothetical protein
LKTVAITEGKGMAIQQTKKSNGIFNVFIDDWNGIVPAKFGQTIPT